MDYTNLVALFWAPAAGVVISAALCLLGEAVAKMVYRSVPSPTLLIYGRVTLLATQVMYALLFVASIIMAAIVLLGL